MKQLFFLLLIFFSISAFSQTSVLDIKAENINLEELTLSKVFDGERFVLLSVGGTWCKPCLDQKPFTASLGQQYPQYLKVVFLFFTDTPEKIKARFGNDNDLKDYLLIKSDAIEQLSIKTYPTNVLVDPNGNIVENDISLNDVGSLIK